jgi:hypothetical protein
MIEDNNAAKLDHLNTRSGFERSLSVTRIAPNMITTIASTNLT